MSDADEQGLICSDGSRERGDPLAATAPYTLRWLLLEIPSGWPEKALTANVIRPYARALSDIVVAKNARVLLVRRPGRHLSEARSWTVVDAISRRQASGSWLVDRSIETAIDTFAGRAPLTDDAELRLLVCTHGKHDQCCAVRGRPVAAALAERWPTETWECTHLGGDRFAGNVLILPSGTYYGNLDGPDVVGVVEDHLAGRVSADHLRGVTTVSQVGQAAISEVLRAWGPADLASLRTRVDTHTGDTWTVTVTGHPRGPARVRLERVILPPARRSCHAAIDQVAVTYAAKLIDELG